MKKLVLLFLTLITLNVTAQDTIVSQPKKQFTLESLFPDSLNLPKLNLPNLDLNNINWKKITKFATVYGAVNGGNSLSDVDVYSVTNGLQTQTIETPYDYSVILGVRKISRMGYEPKEAFKTG